MIRRRRTQREIPFSFDSFLDVVANVVGIILRLILVAWVGARSYHPTPGATPAPAPLVQEETADAAEPPLPPDPLADQLAQGRRVLTTAKDQLLDQTRLVELAKEQRTRAAQELSDAAAKVQTLQTERTAAEGATGSEKDGKPVELSLPEIDHRIQLVNADIDALQKLPSAKHSLHYQTPVSQTLQSEELFFECQSGRVTVIDVGAMLEQLHHDRGDKTKALATQWEVAGETDPVGAFRMHYVLERERGPADGPGGPPLPDAQFSYGASWTVEPINGQRGEPEEAALAAASDFRRVVDALDPKTTAVTFWVYPDSFPLYRRLRDYLHDRDFVVAGRPLPEGMPIGSSRHGTASRGQ